MRHYTGIGSRQTPAGILALMTELAVKLREKDFILRSGGADGADLAFEEGAGELKEIYLPWKGFNGSDSPLYSPVIPAALVMAEKYHPAWERCSQGAQKMHARNCCQVLGDDLATPSKLIVCWTPGGLMKGGTAQALRIGKHHNIPIFNLGNATQHNKILDFVKNP